jgi:superfamily II DNA/RNA helicase
MPFSEFALPEGVLTALTERNIIEPSPIQQQSLPFSLAGRDILGRARTGTGKTLAFALPIINRLSPNGERNHERGRKPRALILAPTRELAKQVAGEFAWVAPHLAVTAIYGGASYGTQERDLTRGVDVVVGTPGRVIDHLERGNLDFSETEIVVLDEADEMLNMGFQEAVERVLASTPVGRQTMLFSATIPSWVERLARQYLREHKVVDLVGRETSVPSNTQHLAVMVNGSARTKTLADILTVQGPERAMVFTRTKREADELALELIQRGFETEAIHGDLAQVQRERALESFRAGRARVLVATDVAARGIDIAEVDLVVQHFLPHDAEAYVHRSGRTGRAGRAGTALILYTEREGRALRALEYRAGLTFSRRDTPTPQEVWAAAARYAATKVREVPSEVLGAFHETADALLAELGPEALSRALAWVAGWHKAPRAASLITGEEGFRTVTITSTTGRNITIPRAVALLAQATDLGSRALGKIKLFEAEPGIAGVVADVPANSLAKLLSQSPLEGNILVELTTELPEFVDDRPERGDRNERGGSGGYRGQGGGGGGGYRGNNDRNAGSGGGGYRGNNDRNAGSAGAGRSDRPARREGEFAGGSRRRG